MSCRTSHKNWCHLSTGHVLLHVGGGNNVLLYEGYEEHYYDPGVQSSNCLDNIKKSDPKLPVQQTLTLLRHVIKANGAKVV